MTYNPIVFYLLGCVFSGIFLLYMLTNIKNHSPQLFKRAQKCKEAIFLVVLSSWAFILFAIYIYFKRD